MKDTNNFVPSGSCSTLTHTCICLDMVNPADIDNVREIEINGQIPHAIIYLLLQLCVGSICPQVLACVEISTKKTRHSNSSVEQI